MLSSAALRRWSWLALFVAGLALGAYLGWRWFLAEPQVTVQFASEAAGLPLEIEVIPAEVRAEPGELVSVIYRIRNRTAEPVNAFGVVKLLPSAAGRQVEFFVIECGGQQTFAAGAVRDYQVVFQVRPESTWVETAFTVQHTFTPATIIDSGGAGG